MTLVGNEREVLIVEDDSSTREVLSAVLEQDGYRTLTAQNGREALDVLLAGERPRAIVLDIHLPLMDGNELCAELVKNPSFSEIPVILISAYTKPEDAPANVIAFFRKPFPFLNLLNAVEKACGGTASAAPDRPPTA
ncbi:MAG: response regulator [Thermoanaerobaculia bacterium]